MSANGSPEPDRQNGQEHQPIALFVYGTLKRGFPAHHVLGQAECLGETRTAARHRLVDCGSYPGLVGGELAVEGEIYRILPERLGAIDRFEGYEYQRGLIELEDGRVVQAYLYRAEGEREQLGDAGSCWRGPASQLRAVDSHGPDLAKVTRP